VLEHTQKHKVCFAHKNVQGDQNSTFRCHGGHFCVQYFLEYTLSLHRYALMCNKDNSTMNTGNIVQSNEVVNHITTLTNYIIWLHFEINEKLYQDSFYVFMVYTLVTNVQMNTVI